MGISGLLPFLKNASRSANIKEFRGCTVAIDSYCWLHKGAFACADKLALGEPTDQYVYYCMKYVNSLLAMSVRPIMVFDGGHLPSKKDVEKQRRERRDLHRKKAAQLLREGRRAEARDALQKCVDITSEMAVQLMKACRDKGVDCIVAPYEADAQLAHLNQTGIADLVITEDSDLVLFGCTKILFKMDFSGNGVLIEKEHLNKAMGLKADSYTFTKFRWMCMLSGCDYLASLPGIGLKKANRVFQRTRHTDITTVLKRLPVTLNMNTLTVPAEYIEGFFKAENTFLHQLVFDPMTRMPAPLNPYPQDVNGAQMTYAGPPLEPERAYQIALGNIDVNTGKRIADFDPDTFKPEKCRIRGNTAKDMLCNLSIWDKNYRPESRLRIDKSECSHALGAFETSSGRDRDTDVKRPVRHSQHLPGKRRSPENDLQLSKEQLANMYSHVSNGEPLKKRLKTDHISDDSIQSTAPYELQDKSYCESDGERENDVEPRTQPHASQLSPRHTNVFRVSRHSNKSFHLNATKTTVTSRFFTTSSKPFKKTAFFDQMSKPHVDNSIKMPVTRLNVDVTGLEVAETRSMDRDAKTFADTEVNEESDEVPCSLFSPPARRRTMITHTAPPSGDKAASGPQPTDCIPYNIDSANPNSGESGPNNALSDSITRSPASGESETSMGLWSIDSDILRSLQSQSDVCCPVGPDAQTVERSSQDTCLNQGKSLVKVKSANSGKATPRAGCKASGLSKRSTKENKSQASIKSFFSTFSLNKSEEKLSAARKPLSPSNVLT